MSDEKKQDDLDKQFTEEERQAIYDKMVVPKNIPQKKDIRYPNEITEFFYSLPLSDEQRKDFYNAIMDDYKKDPESLNFKLDQ